MKTLITLIIIVLLANTFITCNSSSNTPKTFCDTACSNDSLKFVGKHSSNPHVFISFKNCNPDTLLWSYDGMGVNRKMGFADLFGQGIKLNKQYARSFFNDTSYAWLLFNDCNYGRGYFLKIPFNKTANIGRSGRALNSFDHKFSVDENLAAYTDRGNIFVEDMMTGKKAMMTFGEQIDFDPDDIHNSIDSVNITATRIWVKVKLKEGWKELGKNITMQ